MPKKKKKRFYRTNCKLSRFIPPKLETEVNTILLNFFFGGVQLK